MDKDSEIRRLREYVRFYLRREIEGDRNEERSRIQFLFKESSLESRKSKKPSFKKSKNSRSKKNQLDNVRDKKRIATLKEEIGRNYHSTNSDPHSLYNILDDVEVNIFPIKMGTDYQVNIKTKDKEFNKIFPSEEEAQIWSKNQVMKLSKKFTQ